MSKASTLFESFSWFRPELRATGQVGGKLRIRGKAIFPTISGNKRQYIEKELTLSARSLANAAIDVNHEYDLWEQLKTASEEKGIPFTTPAPKFKGNVFDAEWEDGAIEYVAEINHPEYVAKIRDRQKVMEGEMTREEYILKWGKEPIYGVSISASYRPYSSEKKGDVTIPHGLIFKRLSLVEDPEKPGIKGTTISVMETLNECSLEEASAVNLLLTDYAPQLVKIYQQEVIEKMKQQIEGVKQIPMDNAQALTALEAKEQTREAEPPPVEEKVLDAKARNKIPEGKFAYTDENGVGHLPIEDAAHCRNAMARFNQTSIPADKKAAARGKICAAAKRFGIDSSWCKDGAKETDEPSLSDVTGMTEAELGEPFAGYKDFADCVAKNRDKSDPQAYCGSIKHKVEDKPKETEAGIEDALSKVEASIKKVEEDTKYDKVNAKADAAIEALRCASAKFKSITDKQEQTDAKVEETKRTLVEEFTRQLNESLLPIKANLDTRAPAADLEEIKKAVTLMPGTLQTITEAMKTGNDKVTIQLDELMKIVGMVPDTLKTITEATAEGDKAQLGKLDVYRQSMDKVLAEMQEKMKALTAVNLKLAEAETRFNEFGTRLSSVDEKLKAFTAINLKLTETETRFNELGTRLSGVDDKLKETEAVSAKLSETELKLGESIGKVLKLEETAKKHNDYLVQLVTKEKRLVETEAELKKIGDRIATLETHLKPVFKAPDSVEETEDKGKGTILVDNPKNRGK